METRRTALRRGATLAALLTATPAALQSGPTGGALARFLPVCLERGEAAVGIELHGRIGQPLSLPRLDRGATARAHHAQHKGYSDCQTSHGVPLRDGRHGNSARSASIW